MDQVERIMVFVLGGGFGYVFGYIVAHLRAIEKKIDKVDDHVLHHEVIVKEDETQVRTRDERGSMPPWVSFINIAALVVILIVSFAAWRSDQAVDAVKANTKADFVAVCVAGAEIREVQRQTVDAIFNLAVGALERPPESPPLTETEVKQMNAYIDRVNFFRQDMYNKIEPTKKCAPYVTDDNVEPPSPDFPHIKRRP